MFQFYVVYDYNDKIHTLSDIIERDLTQKNTQLEEIMNLFWDNKVKDYEILMFDRLKYARRKWYTLKIKQEVEG